MSSPPAPTKIPNTGRPRDAPKVTNQSPRDRIDNILESARARKIITMDDSNSSAPASPRAELLRSSVERAAEAESSADEETSIVVTRSHKAGQQDTSRVRPVSEDRAEYTSQEYRRMEVKWPRSTRGGGHGSYQNTVRLSSRTKAVWLEITWRLV